MDTPSSGPAGVPSWGAGRSAFEAFRPAAAKLKLRETSFRAMGCDCQILVLGGGSQLLELGVDRVRALDTCWSRFTIDSELSVFNDSAGERVAVSADLLVLLQRSVAGYELSRGLFNPFLTEQILAAGYDKDFAELAATPVTELAALPPGAPSSEGKDWGSRRSIVAAPSPLSVDVESSTVRMRAGLAIDSGGMGKGLGADLVCDFLLAHGARGAMVNLGGDVAVAGAYPDEGWRIGIDDPLGRADAGMSVVLREGALCTSGVLRRRWQQSDGSISHHIIDPDTGRPLAPNGLVGASAIAPSGWLAEVLTKTALVGGEAVATELMDEHSDCALLLWDEQAQVRQLPVTS